MLRIKANAPACGCMCHLLDTSSVEAMGGCPGGCLCWYDSGGEAASEVLQFLIVLRDRYNVDDRMGGLGDWCNDLITRLEVESSASVGHHDATEQAQSPSPVSYVVPTEETGQAQPWIVVNDSESKRSITMDRIAINGYESSHLDGAHVIWEDSTGATIVAFVPEPRERVEQGGLWPSTWEPREDAWREAVRHAVRDAWGEPDSDEAVKITLQFDPGRDKAMDEVVASGQAQA